MAEPLAVSHVSSHEFVALDFELTYGSIQVTLVVRGEIDAFTAPAMAGLVGALVDQGRLDVVLDLSQVAFMDAAGLRVIIDASTRLGAAGRTVSIRSPSVPVHRFLERTGLDGLIEAPSRSLAAALGPEQRAGDRSALVSATASGLAVDSRMSSLPAHHAVVDAALRLVTAMAQATIEGADGVSVSLTRRGQLTTVAASDDTIAQMDRDQYATGEGPCVAAAAEGHWFHAESLVDEIRWPQFIPRAISGGIASILATPLMVADRPVGSLNIYSNTPRAFGPKDQELATLFASQASGVLTEARPDQTTEEAAQRLRYGLTVRENIAQAQGVIMAHGGSAEAAYADLRHSARHGDVTVAERAGEVLERARRQEPADQVTS
ncbi:MAG: anti-sigma factor antagonist [Aquihabitans sp.]